jgi:hypothetical protein
MTEIVKIRRRASKKAIIKLLMADNPKRAGTLAAERYALYHDGMTVADYLAAGGRTGDVNHDATEGYIALELPA